MVPIMVTHHQLLYVTPPNIDIPKHWDPLSCTEFTSTLELATEDQCPTLGTNCHKGVVLFWIICITVHAQRTSHQSTSNDEKTNNEAFPFTLFHNYGLQKMSVQLHPR